MLLFQMCVYHRAVSGLSSHRPQHQPTLTPPPSTLTWTSAIPVKHILGTAPDSTIMTLRNIIVSLF